MREGREVREKMMWKMTKRKALSLFGLFTENDTILAIS
jgi:hypothetical protein